MHNIDIYILLTINCKVFVMNFWIKKELIAEIW